ncbi:MAG: site-specific DNA-methyltransferase, partial [Chloroflexi bacterium]|nr:site-specific DNA-methyltransferase [Chloroflexota bacterium]
MLRDCLSVLRDIPDNTFDLVITSPPYDRQPRYGNGEDYARDWYAGFFLDVTREILRTLKPEGSFVLNYRSKRHGDERGTLQYELVFWLRDQGFKFAEDFVWGKPSPPPGRFDRFLKDAVEYCFHFAKSSSWQFFPEHVLS